MSNWLFGKKINLGLPVQEINMYQDISWCLWNQNNDRWYRMLFTCIIWGELCALKYRYFLFFPCHSCAFYVLNPAFSLWAINRNIGWQSDSFSSVLGPIPSAFCALTRSFQPLYLVLTIHIGFLWQLRQITTTQWLRQHTLMTLYFWSS